MNKRHLAATATIVFLLATSIVAVAKNPKPVEIAEPLQVEIAEPLQVEALQPLQVEPSPLVPVQTFEPRANFGFGSNSGSVDLYTVPQGKRLIVQFVSGDVVMFPVDNTLDETAEARCSAIAVGVDFTVKAAHRLIPVVVPNGNAKTFLFSSPITMYVESGDIFKISCRTLSMDGGSVYGAMTGYLIDVE